MSTAAVIVGLVQGLDDPGSGLDAMGSEPVADGQPALGSELADLRVEPAGPDAATATVVMEPGWAVPELNHHQSITLGDGSQLELSDHDHHHGIEELDAGTATVGGRVEIGSERAMVVIHGSGPRLLAYRIGSSDDEGVWGELSLTPDDGPDGLEGEEGHGARSISAGPFFVEEGRSHIDFVVIGGDTSSFEVTMLGLTQDRPDRPDRELDSIPDPAGAALGQNGGPFAQPAIIGRDQWADESWDYQKTYCDEGPSIADHTQAVVIHHTVTDNGYTEAEVDDMLRAIYYSHVVINGWCDVGYNFIVDRFGRIWEARTGSIDESVIGGHARGFNTGTVGIALLGQHQPGAQPSAGTVSPEAEAAVRALAHWKLGIHGVDQAGKTWLRNRSSSLPARLAAREWHYVPTVLGHRDLGITSCPGNHATGLVDDLPAELAAERDVSLPYSFVNWQAHSHGPGFVVAESGGGIRPAGSATPWSSAPAGLAGGSEVIAVGGGFDGGYLLSVDGTVTGFGAAPAVNDKPAGAATAVDLVVRSDGQSGWVLDDRGVLHGFGSVGVTGPNSVPNDPVAAVLDDDGVGYVVDRRGRLYPVGGAPAREVSPAVPASADVVDFDLRADGESGWVLDDTGRVHGFGGTVSDRVQPPAAVRAMAAAATGTGGWVLDAEGQLWPFDNARLVFPVSTNATVAGAVDLARVGSVYSPDFLTSGKARYIAAINKLFLGIDPNEVEIDLQVTELEQGAWRSELTEPMARSAHWSGASIDEMYRNALGREPDTEGRAYWLNEIGSGLQLQDLGTYFYGSAEYANSAGGTAAYVSGLYNVLLGRAPDLDGLAYWTELLDSGQANPPDVAHGFYASIESRRDRAADLYERIIGNPPSDEDRQHWAERLLAVGDAGVAAELAASSEYYKLVVDGPEP